MLQPGARGDSLLSGQLASPMALLLVAGALVLLVACLNVANLQLSRTEARRRELAVRSALGARRSQLVRLALIDGGLMAGAAGLAAVWLAVLLKDRRVAHCALWPPGRAVDSIRRPRHRGGGPDFVRSGARHRSASRRAGKFFGGNPLKAWPTVEAKPAGDVRHSERS